MTLEVKRPSLTMQQISDIQLTYPAGGRRHSTATPLGRVMYRRHISVARLAQLSGVQRVMISNYLSRERPLRSRKHIDAFASILHARVVDILLPMDARQLGTTLPANAVWFRDVWECDPSHAGS